MKLILMNVIDDSSLQVNCDDKIPWGGKLYKEKVLSLDLFDDDI